MDALIPRRAAERLLADKADIGRAVTERLYAERPELLARHGANGRVRCLEDIQYTVEHLVPAVDLGDPALFLTYVRWLDDLLRARNVDTADVLRSIELVDEVVVARFPADEAAAITPHLQAGAGLLRAGASA